MVDPASLMFIAPADLGASGAVAMVPPEAATAVRLGVLTAAEWAAIEPVLQDELEADSLELLAWYGDDFFLKDRARHRADLSLAYGVC